MGAESTLQGAVLLKLYKDVESSVEYSHPVLQYKPCCIRFFLDVTSFAVIIDW